MADGAAEEALPRSEYERKTQGNIAHNKQKLRQLGLLVDTPAIMITKKAAPKPKAKTPSAAAAASTTVVTAGFDRLIRLFHSCDVQLHAPAAAGRPGPRGQPTSKYPRHYRRPGLPSGSLTGEL